jgi:hypothetical protein
MTMSTYGATPFSFSATSIARVLLTALLVAIVSISATTAHAVLVAYEGFDYDPGNLNGLAGGTGWTTAWNINSFTSVTTGTVVAGGLTYTDGNGNQLVVGGNSAEATGQPGSAQHIRELPQTGADGTTTWISYIGQRLTPHATDDENLARAASLQIHDVGTTPVEKLAIGKGTTSPPSVIPQWSILHSGNVTNAQYSTTSQLETAFLVARVDHIGDSLVADNAWLWVNPNLDSEPDINNADASFQGALDFSYDRIRAFAGNTTGGNPYALFAYDEIRLGTTYADVAPIAGAAQTGDFDEDGDVDGRDFLEWQRGNSPSPLSASDLSDWQTNYGIGTFAATTAVPEPGCLGMLFSIAFAASRLSRASARSRRG